MPLGTIVRFASVDKAGNFEAPKEITVDDAPSTREAAEPVSLGGNLARYLDPQGDEDWFAFEADGRSSYRVQLHGLPEDYDVELYDAQGKKVAAPGERGKRSETIREKLTTGRYYARVVGHDGAWSAQSPYRLKVDQLGAGRP